MAANTLPIFVGSANDNWAQGALTANTTTDLTAGTIYLVLTAGANGMWVRDLRFQALGTNVASLINIWLNNGSTTATAANNTWIGQYATQATTASNLLAQPFMAWILERLIKPTERIYITLATGVAAGYDATGFAGDL